MQKILCCIFVLLFLLQLLSPFSIFPRESGMRRKKNTAAPLESVAGSSQDKRSSSKRQSFFRSMSEESSRCDGPETTALDSNNYGDLRHLISANSQEKRSMSKRQSFFESISEGAFQGHGPENDELDLHEVIADMVRKRNHDSVDDGVELHQAKKSFGNSQDKRSLSKRQHFFRATSDDTFVCHDLKKDEEHLDQTLAGISPAKRSSKRQCFFQSTSDDTFALHDPENDDADLAQTLADMVWERNCDSVNGRIVSRGAEPGFQNCSTSHQLDTKIADSGDDEEIIPIAIGSGTIFEQASYQQTHAGHIMDYNDAGDDAYICSHCTALFWSAKALKK